MYVIIYDFGTSGVKTCLFEIGEDIRLITSANAGYGMYISDDGGAEQDAEEWWEALCRTTHELFETSDVKPQEIEGMSVGKARAAQATSRAWPSWYVVSSTSPSPHAPTSGRRTSSRLPSSATSWSKSSTPSNWSPAPSSAPTTA